MCIFGLHVRRCLPWHHSSLGRFWDGQNNVREEIGFVRPIFNEVWKIERVYCRNLLHVNWTRETRHGKYVPKDWKSLGQGSCFIEYASLLDHAYLRKPERSGLL